MKKTNRFKVAIFLILFSCNEDQNRMVNCSVSIFNPYKTGHFQKIKELSFNLDSIQYVGEFTGSAYLSTTNQVVFLDNISNRLIFFKATGGDKINSIHLPDILHDQKIQGFKYINKDSILLYSPKGKRLVLINDTGKIGWQYAFKETKNPSFQNLPPPSAYIGNSSPMYVVNDTIICTGFLIGEHENLQHEKRFTRIRVSMKTNKVSYDIPYPDVYKLPNWGGDLFRSVFTAYNAKYNTLLISTPADHNITVVNSENISKAYFLGPRDKLCITSFKYPKSDRKRFINKDINVHFFTNPSYRNIMYDEYRDLYLRILELPLKEDKLNNKGIGVKSTRILIYDSQFKYIDEFNPSSNLSSENILIIKDGILFLNKTNQNENKAIYTLYDIDK
ncbi:MAG: DUF4221 family protein [Sediminibacterium sp.]|nr:DUF4221 family protein [Sediminibacterium sp.]